MLPETQLLESQRVLSHYLGVFLAEPNPTISAHTAAMAPDLVRQHIAIITREAERAAVYIASGVNNPRRDMLISLKAECLQLAADAEAALA